jgi:hypothetical protein
MLGTWSLFFGTFFCLALPAAHALHGSRLPLLSSRPNVFAVFLVMSLLKCPNLSWACSRIVILSRLTLTISLLAFRVLFMYITYNDPFGVRITMSNTIFSSPDWIQIAFLPPPIFHPNFSILEFVTVFVTDDTWNVCNLSSSFLASISNRDRIFT